MGTGAIVDRDALVASVRSGHLAGYAGDTWYPQPAPTDHPWRSLPAEAMTIHYSGMTQEAQARIAEGVTEMLEAHLEGRDLPEDFLVVDQTARAFRRRMIIRLRELYRISLEDPQCRVIMFASS